MFYLGKARFGVGAVMLYVEMKIKVNVKDVVKTFYSSYYLLIKNGSIQYVSGHHISHLVI